MKAARPSPALLRTAFAAFADSSRPDLVYFKSLYRLARDDEGYPVKQEWLAGLPGAQRAEAERLLATPLATLAETSSATADPLPRPLYSAASKTTSARTPKSCWNRPCDTKSHFPL